MLKKKRISGELFLAMMVLAILGFAFPAWAGNLTFSGTSGALPVVQGETVTVDEDLTLTEAGDDSTTITNGRVMIDNPQTGDVLGVTNTASITGSYNSGTGILTLTGAGYASDWQALFRTVTFTTTSASTADRNISFTLGNSLTLEVNGQAHYYEVISSEEIRWDNARDAAAAMSYFGLRGYLATVTSAAENALLTDKLAADAWLGGSDDYHEINTAISGEYTEQIDTEGNFYWVTGPETGTQISTGNYSRSDGTPTQVGSYMNWNDNEPNDSTDEHCLEIYYSGGESGKWNDLAVGSTNVDAYVVEYGGMTGDPELTLSITRTATVNLLPTNITLSTTEIDVTKGENGLVAIISTTDADSGSFTYSLVNGDGDTDNGSFSINESNLLANDADMAVGSYAIRLKTDDGDGGTYVKCFTLTVSDSDGDGVPDTQEVFDGTATGDGSAYKDTNGDGISDYRETHGNFGIASDGEDPGAVTVAENTTAVTTVIAVQATGTVTYAISGGADADLFAIDASTGELTFASAPDYENPTDGDTNNDYVVIIQATDSDDSDTDTQALTVTVTDIAASTVFGLDDYDCYEQDPAAVIDSDVTILEGGSYSGGSISFELADSTTYDTLSLTTDDSASVTDGELSIVGGTIYLGDGSNAVVIGSVNSTYNGEEGQKLTINFSNEFENGDFNDGSSGSTVITGWTVSNTQVKFGTDTIAGLATPTDTTWPTNAGDGFGYTDQNTPSRLGTLTTVLSDEVNDGSGLSVRMTSASMTTQLGYDIVRGPYIYSNGTVSLSVGDKVSFEWKAEGGGDAYDVYGYIVDADTGHIETILDDTGNDSAATTSWADEEITVTEEGRYIFVFVSGTYDYSGGKAAGAQLYIDNVTVTQAVEPATVSDDILTQIARRVTFENTSDNPSAAGRIYTVTAQPAESDSASATSTISITPVNDAPTAITLDEYEIDVTDGSVGTLSTTDADSDTFTYTFVSGDGDDYNASFTISEGVISAVSTGMAIGNYSVRIQTDDGDKIHDYDAVGTYEEVLTLTVSDSDGDGVPDSQEVADGTDPDDDTSFADTDNDGVPDYYEENEDGTANDDGSSYTDSDGDGVSDYRETHGPFGIVSDGEDPGAVTVEENTTQVTTAFTVQEAAAVTYSIYGGDDGDLFEINSLTGKLTFASPPDYENPSDNDTNNQYEVILQATDGTSTDTQNLTVTVTDVTDEPETWDARSLTNSGGELFLGGNYIELGISNWGDFGTLNAKPATFFGTAVRNTVGMSYDPDMFDTDLDIRVDYFLPGSPEERFAVGYELDGSTYTNSNSAQMGAKNMTTTVEDTSSEEKLSATLKSTWDEKMVVQQKVSFNEGDAFFRNVVTICNISDETMDTVRYLRSFDPDNTKDQGGSYATANTVLKTIADGDGKEVVVAKTYSSSDPVYQKNGSRMPIFFYSKDERARVSIFGFSNNNPYNSSAWDSPAAKDNTLKSDTAITITFEAESLAPGEAARFVYYTSLDERDFDEVIEEIEADEEEDPVSEEVEEPIVSSSLLSIDGTPTDVTAADIAYSFTPTVTNPDGDAVSFTIENQPAWASFDTDTGKITGTPTDSDAGTYTEVTISVSDAAGNSDTLTPFNIVVNAVNDAPELSGTPTTSVDEGDEYSFAPILSDADDIDVHKFSVENLPSWAEFDITTGEISGTPDADDNGEYTDITISVEDGAGATASLASFSITVNDANTSPRITSGDGFTVVEGETEVGTVTAIDEDGDTLTFSISGTDADLFGIDADGIITFNTTPVYDEPVDADMNNVYEFTLTVQDNGAGSGTEAQDVTVTVLKDSDGNGISDIAEGDLTVDTDGDGTPDYLDEDDDGDGISDADEGSRDYTDTDGDGTPDYQDDDSDGDGVADSVEGSEDTDGDGTPDYQDEDNDGDGISDIDEGSADNIDSDGDGIPDYRDPDSDGDGIDDVYEGTADTDGDGTPDYHDDDSDGDGISDEEEGSTDTDNDGTPDFQDPEADGDGVGDEVENGGANNGDGNGDGIADRLQKHVTTTTNIDETEYVTLEAPEGTQLNDVRAIENPSPEDMPEGSELPNGLYEFTIGNLEPGASAQLKVYLPEGSSADSYLKYGPTPDNEEYHWYEFVYDGVTGAEIEDNVITLHFIDGDEGDDDLTANGTIVDAGGPMLDSGDSDDYGPLGGSGCFIGTMTGQKSPWTLAGLALGALSALLALAVAMRFRTLRRVVGFVALACLLTLSAPGAGQAEEEKTATPSHPFYAAAGLGFAYVDEAIGAEYDNNRYEFTVDTDLYPVFRLGYVLNEKWALEFGFRWDIYSGEIDEVELCGTGNPKGYTYLLGPVYTFDAYEIKYLGSISPQVHLNLGLTHLHHDLNFPATEFEPALGFDFAVGARRGNIDLRLGYRYFKLDCSDKIDEATHADDSLNLSGFYMEVAWRFGFGM